jgi:CrcB protein
VKKNFSVGIGGALGAVCRFGVQHIPIPVPEPYLPFLTMAVNLFGSFLLGFFLIFFIKCLPIHADLRLGITTGFLGGFTTFSTLCKETFFLAGSGNAALCALYAGATVLLGLAAAWFGILCAKRLERRRVA